MIKYLYICDKCGIEKFGTSNNYGLPKGWDYYYGMEPPSKHLCTKCKPKKKKTKYVNPNLDSDPGVGALYGRT